MFCLLKHSELIWQECLKILLLIWAGCGCHKDLNNVWGGYFAMSKWWEKHKQTPSILLANCNNAAVLADMVFDSNTIAPAQE
jgi:hypothetical protein